MIKDALLQERIQWYPHKAQQEIIDCHNREVVICAGRRFGKSAVCGYLVAKTFLQGVVDGKESMKIWIVAPTYDLSRKVFEYVVKFLRTYDKRFQDYITDRPNPMVKITESFWIQCKSADQPAGLLGEELDLLVLDEAANISKTIWFDYLMPTTASKTRQGKVIFISTPRGKNWFYDLYMQNKIKGGAFHFTSLDGVEIDHPEWDRLKAISPADWFQQNYEAVFTEKASSVFRGVKDVVFAADLSSNLPYIIEEPKINRYYIGGLDLAQIHDFSVLTIMETVSHKVVYWDRFHKISYPLQINRIESVAKKYNAKIVVELNSIGLSIADELKARGVRVEDFRTGGSIINGNDVVQGTKDRMIEKLSVDIESKNIHIPPIQQLIDELEAYTHLLTPGGNITYGAPEGGYDDCVISLGLANWGLLGQRKEENKKAASAMPIRRKRFQYN